MKKIIYNMAATRDTVILSILRISLGLVMLPHGAQQLLGLFDGYGFTGSTNYYTQHMGIPMFIAVLVVLGQSIGSVLLILGLFSRFAAFGIIIIMIGAVFMVHLSNGFFMNWYGTQKGEGFEYFILLFGVAVPILIYGSGKYSIDRFIQGKLENN
ncbi:DoxX family protein [Mucilaginibacter sp.]|jgi:putative oxidoreductase|uniref:DoxX family protein n=1 Tax=Mucilaginibacter sp. TaxID=1882438 RepID=UPI002C108B4F|nr:DoxX family protein [Mucilaginibacter sp.]HTI59294.1 DoxX family protein [Mucilaginibacter sp.]